MNNSLKKECFHNEIKFLLQRLEGKDIAGDKDEANCISVSGKYGYINGWTIQNIDMLPVYFFYQ